MTFPIRPDAAGAGFSRTVRWSGAPIAGTSLWKNHVLSISSTVLSFERGGGRQRRIVNGSDSSGEGQGPGSLSDRHDRVDEPRPFGTAHRARDLSGDGDLSQSEGAGLGPPRGRDRRRPRPGSGGRDPRSPVSLKNSTLPLQAAVVRVKANNLIDIP